MLKEMYVPEHAQDGPALISLHSFFRKHARNFSQEVFSGHMAKDGGNAREPLKIGWLLFGEEHRNSN